MPNIFSDKDTIAAISTPPGQGGIAVIRISGPNTINVLKKTFVFLNCNLPWSSIKPRFVYTGSVISPLDKNIIDKALMVYFKKPGSYTGEDAAELSCHGGTYIKEKVLESCVKAGCRLAQG
ncbi:MAG: tRNA uridine-5-carboxymethylaminomethyl(34) synthesis GTPase MnmE, partial [bacterium]